MKTTLRILFIVIVMHSFVNVGISSASYNEDSHKESIKSGEPSKNYQQAGYSVAEKNSIITPDGTSRSCHDIFGSEQDMKVICQEYYEIEKNEYEECYKKRVDRTDTEAGLKAIDRICLKKSNAKAWKAIEWYLERQKFENFNAAD